VNLLILEPGEVSESGDVLLTDARAGHVLNVLKAAPGHDVRVGLLDGPRGVGTVQAADEGAVRLRCSFSTEVPPKPRVDLLLALPRPKVMRRLWAQLAALGVGRIMLTNAARVERNYFDTHVLSADCYRPLLVEGLQQAKDTRLPEVSIHKQLKVLVEDQLDHLFGGGGRIVADPASEVPPGTVARRHAGARLLLAVGPEGGWNAFELALLKAHGFESAGMGPRTLRTDTACVALLSLVSETEREDYGAERGAGVPASSASETGRGAPAREGCGASRGAGVPASAATGAGRGAPATENGSQ
jgi:RsmE family RNA methyltransferase